MTTPDRYGYRDYWVFTIQMGMWRYAEYLNIPIIDITAKSGIKTFAPEWENLMAYKRGRMDSREYSELYYKKVIATLSTNPEDWKKLEEHKTFALACYCKPGEFCHRHLFGMLCVTHLQSLGHQVLFQGELVPHPNNRSAFSRQTEE